MKKNVKNEEAVRNRWLLLMWVVSVAALLVGSYYAFPYVAAYPAPFPDERWLILAFAVWVFPCVISLWLAAVVNVELFGQSLWEHNITGWAFGWCPIVNVGVAIFVLCKLVKRLWDACV